MINVEFFISNNTITGFSICGHANFNEYGKDIVCASVTSAVQLCINGITECLKVNAKVNVYENKIKFNLLESCDNESAKSFLQALYLQLDILSQDYPKNINISTTEV